MEMHSTHLTIKILFCYSPEYLNNTYNDLLQLITDNNNLCAITGGILSNNSQQYTVNMINIHTGSISNLQDGIECLNEEGVKELLADYIDGYYPDIDELQEKYQAHVVVLQPLLCNYSHVMQGTAAGIGFNRSNEACLAIARSMRVCDNNITDILPTILAHEIGHLLGCRHSIEEGLEIFQKEFAGSYGHAILEKPHEPPHAVTNKARSGTIMSYALKPVWYYSNPTIFKYKTPDNNIACGVQGISEAYKVIEANLSKLASTV